MITQVAIVDDSKEFMDYVVQVLSMLDNVLVDAYSNRIDFMKALDDKEYHIVFLDYEMPDCNGFLLAEQAQLKSAFIIIMTSHHSLSIPKECIKRKVFRYITKDNFRDEAYEALAEARSMLKDCYVTVKMKHYELDLDLRTVFYVYSVEHYLIYHTQDMEYKTRESIANIKDKLIANGFGEVASNTYVNLHKIRTLNEDREVILIDGSHFKISRNKYKQLKMRYMEII